MRAWHPSRPGNRDARIGFAKLIRMEISVGISRSSRRSLHSSLRRPLAHQALELLHLGLTDRGKYPDHIAVEDEHLAHGVERHEPVAYELFKNLHETLYGLCGSSFVLFVSSRLLKTLISTASAKATGLSS